MAGTVVFDLYGVIGCHQSAAARHRIEELAGVAGEAFWSAYWAERPPYDAGLVDAGAYWAGIAGRVGGLRAPVPDLVAADLASWSRFDPEMIALLRTLAAGGWRLGLLSNAPAELAAAVEAGQDWLDVFAVRVFSARLGVAKPDPRIYRHCLAALGAPATGAYFVDDRAENVTAAEALGMRGVLFTGPDDVRVALGYSTVQSQYFASAGIHGNGSSGQRLRDQASTSTASTAATNSGGGR
ncbi:putative hydrolase of the HAD superfamily [Micromonospora auratinigra]|uniref:Putative hydrolase of the HAD superfamily n=1 Tax=Micromonospora auratinigra TaxID=261654 RepID=A0A1A8ZFX4_9ACTN|nr:HAD family phosphatase [Micromonospora auratinigra]SBT42777.1 putative hydrolase of the HAD superfamily [Micromonospora auratinigra]